MQNLLELHNVTIEYYSLKNDRKSVITAVENVSLNIKKGEIYALAGESGCGKSTLAKAITKLVRPKSGDIIFNGKNIYKHSKEESKQYPTEVQMVFQNPYSSLNPRAKIIQILSEPLEINKNYSKKNANGNY